MMVLVSILAIMLIIFKSLQWIWTGNRNSNRKIAFFPIEYFIVLIITYVILLLGFGLIYTTLMVAGLPILIEAGQAVRGSFLQMIQTGLYFSGVTLFSVGYGDIAPMSVGRLVAIIEALIGYLLPAAFMMKSFMEMEESYPKKSNYW